MTADANKRITAAIVTTERALRSDGPKTAFIAELFTHPGNRREGLAEELLSHALQVLHGMGHKTVAVTVSSANAAAIAFYLSRASAVSARNPPGTKPRSARPGIRQPVFPDGGSRLLAPGRR
ncbi:acetyltransferase [Arthrobacter sp. Hiyo4]|nr:acetyltransferase [Arthrobacter sp. Hiyo4]